MLTQKQVIKCIFKTPEELKNYSFVRDCYNSGKMSARDEEIFSLLLSNLNEKNTEIMIDTIFNLEFTHKSQIRAFIKSMINASTSYCLSLYVVGPKFLCHIFEAIKDEHEIDKAFYDWFMENIEIYEWYDCSQHIKDQLKLWKSRL